MIRSKWTGALLLSLFATSSYATSIPNPFDSGGAQTVLWAEHNTGGIGWHYDPITETLSTASEWEGPWMSVFPAASGPSLFATDITARYFVSAHVDHFGNVSGGTFAFLASSPTLGLNGIQPILAGSILGSTGANEFQPFDSDLLASVDYYNPLLASFTLKPDLALLTVHTCFCVTSDTFNPWDNDSRFSTIQPDIFAIHTIPEPSAVALFAVSLGVSLLGVGTWARRRTMRSPLARAESALCS
ncbi:MAG TPA: hypothetical protein VG994_08145 [Steroidobacteraceae bacterium]|nr:hypothetical protein [Steroidobacteraceae bacterium]